MAPTATLPITVSAPVTRALGSLRPVVAWLTTHPQSMSTLETRKKTHFDLGAAVKRNPANEVGKLSAAVPVAIVMAGPPIEDTWTTGVPATSQGSVLGHMEKLHIRRSYQQ